MITRGSSGNPTLPAKTIEEPARRLPNLRNTRVVFVTADSSFASPGNPGGVAFLKQAGVQAEELRMGSLGIKGNGHMMMVEKNSRQVLQPIIDWIGKNVTGSNTQSPAPRRGSADSLELKLADTGIFFEFVALSDYNEDEVHRLGTKAVSIEGVKKGIDYVVLIK